MAKPVQEVEFEVVPPESKVAREHELMRVIAYLLDDLIPIPGTKFRIGLDPIIGLIPGLGDASTTAVSSLILIQALRAGVPKVVIARMAANVMLNSLIGIVPGVGDLFSAWFKSNNRNYQLLRQHAAGAHTSTAMDWGFLIGVFAVIIAVVVGLAILAGFVAYKVFSLLFG